jgi:hypothetical protein
VDSDLSEDACQKTSAPFRIRASAGGRKNELVNHGRDRARITQWIILSVSSRLRGIIEIHRGIRARHFRQGGSALDAQVLVRSKQINN